jgi:hypothetical protein
LMPIFIRTLTFSFQPLPLNSITIPRMSKYMTNYIPLIDRLTNLTGQKFKSLLGCSAI